MCCNASIKNMVLLVVISMACGCASIISRSKCEISLASNVENATVKIMDREGKEVNCIATPAKVTLSPKSGYFKPAAYNFVFHKDGYSDYSVGVRSTVNPWYFGNFFLPFGFVGFLIVDPVTGAMWQLDDRVFGYLEKEKVLFAEPRGQYDDEETLKQLNRKYILGIITEEDFRIEKARYPTMRR